VAFDSKSPSACNSLAQSNSSDQFAVSRQLWDEAPRRDCGFNGARYLVSERRVRPGKLSAHHARALIGAKSNHHPRARAPVLRVACRPLGSVQPVRKIAELPQPLGRKASRRCTSLCSCSSGPNGGMRPPREPYTVAALASPRTRGVRSVRKER